MDRLVKARTMFCSAAVAAALIAVPTALNAQTVAPPAAQPPRAPPSGTMTEAKVEYPDGVTATFDITYATLKGWRPLTLDVYAKPSAKPQPVIFFIHGGSFTGGTNRGVEPPWGKLDLLLAQLAARGYVVVAPNYRLSNEGKFPTPIQDVKTAIRWVRANAARFGADPARVGIWGTSAGGSAAALVGASCGSPVLEGADEGNADQSSCVQAAADWFGATDLARLDEMALPGGLVHNSPTSSQSEILGCTLNLCPKEVVQRANPIAYINPKDRQTAFLIAHGDADKAAGWRQSQILHDALKANGIRSELIIVPGADHYFNGIPYAQAKKVLDRTFAFFDEILKP